MAQGLPVKRLYVSPNRGTTDDSGLVGAGGVPTDDTTVNLPIAYQQQSSDNLPDVGAAPDIANVPFSSGSPVINSIVDKLLGTNGQQRYMLWPEKLVRDALSAPHDIMQQNPYPEGSEQYVAFENSRQDAMLPAALNMSALAGTGGFAGAEEGASLGSAPFLRPALKYQGKIYKAPIGAEHMDAIPESLRPEFTRQAMSGEDISNFNFGFMNHKGQFLNREDALKYAIDNGLLSPHDAKFGALTSTLMSDTNQPGAAIEALEKSQSPFYSALEKNVNDIGQNKMTGSQWLGTIANKPGVKPEEMDWTGLKNYLEANKDQPVSKADIQQHLANNKVQVNDVVKGEPADENAPAFNQKVEEILAAAKAKNEPMMRSRAEDIAYEQMGYAPTKYSSYQLPGGENYREHLLTLPPKVQQLTEEQLAKQAKENWGIDWNKATEAEKADYRKLANSNATTQDAYKSSHWDEPNVLAHVRTNERDVAGKSSLHIEEIQSDWHQQGRSKGYRSNEYNRLSNEIQQILKDNNIKNDDFEGSAKLYQTNPKLKELVDRRKSLQNNPSGVPNAPFKNSWPELAMKRMIRLAAEEGKDRISWTSGEAQAARYDLSKHFDAISVQPSIKNSKDAWTWWPKGKNGQSYDSIITDKEGKIVQAGRLWGDIVGKNIDDIVGKDIAKKGLEGNKGKELTGLDLKVGGEGMKGFYDQMLPKMVEKLGKKYGVKVKEGKVGKSLDDVLKDKNMTKQEFENLSLSGRNRILENVNEQKPVHYFDIPEKMKQDVLRKGFPLFSNTSYSAPLAALENSPKLEQIPWNKNPDIGWWKDQGDSYTMYHGTHKDNVPTIVNEGIKAPESGPTAGKVSMALEPNTAHGYAAMGGESGFRAAGAKAKSIPQEDRRVIIAHIPKDWAEENMADMRGNVGETKDNLTNQEKYNAAKKAGKTDQEYYATTELRFKKPIPKEFIKGITKKVLTNK